MSQFNHGHMLLKLPLQTECSCEEFMRKVTKLCAQSLTVDYNSLFDKNRKRQVVQCRQIAFWIMKQINPAIHTGTIAEFFNKDRSTVITSLQDISNDITYYPGYSDLVNKVFSYVKKNYE